MPVRSKRLSRKSFRGTSPPPRRKSARKSPSSFRGSPRKSPRKSPSSFRGSPRKSPRKSPSSFRGSPRKSASSKLPSQLFRGTASCSHQQWVKRAGRRYRAASRPGKYECATERNVDDKYPPERDYLNRLTEAPSEIKWRYTNSQGKKVLWCFNHGAPVEHLAPNYGLLENDNALGAEIINDKPRLLKVMRMWADWVTTARRKSVRGIDISGNVQDVLRSIAENETCDIVRSASGHQDKQAFMTIYQPKQVQTELIPDGLTRIYDFDITDGCLTLVRDNDVELIGELEKITCFDELVVQNDERKQVTGSVYICSAATIYPDVDKPSLLKISKATDTVDLIVVPTMPKDLSNPSWRDEWLSEIQKDVWLILSETFWDLMTHCLSLPLGPLGTYETVDFPLSTETHGDRMLQLLQTMSDKHKELIRKDYPNDEDTVPPTVQHLYFFGDLHGSASSIASILLYLKELGVIGVDGVVTPGNGLISGGDLMDRGYFGETCVLAFYYILIQTRRAISLENPAGFCGIARGNHEDCGMTKDYGHDVEDRLRKEASTTKLF